MRELTINFPITHKKLHGKEEPYRLEKLIRYLWSPSFHFIEIINQYLEEKKIIEQRQRKHN